MLAAFTFVPGLSGGFVFDDVPNIVENASLHIKFLDLDSVLYATYSFQPGHGSRALSMLTFALDYWRSGLNATAFKITNLAIHALITFSLAILFRRLLVIARYPASSSAWGALVAATVWAIHPLQVSTVLYVVQRMQMLCTLFMVLSLWSYVRLRQAQIDDKPARAFAGLTFFFWALGFASKEDAVLLPAYTFALELTLLKFEAARPSVASSIRRTYASLLVAVIAVFALFVVPQYWHWGLMPGREFSSLDRLLSQSRVLTMYLGQMLLPLQNRMPFYYDTLEISRGLLQPPTTLLALLVLGALLTWAWIWRHRHPLFSFGVFLFFAGHALTSNILNLELAFEHRNYLPLIGIDLAMADLCVVLWRRVDVDRRLFAGLVTAVVVTLSATTLARAYAWGDPIRLAQQTLQSAPDSARAWMDLGGVYVTRSGGKAASPDFARAIAINEQGAKATGSPAMWSNVVLYKTRRGDVGPNDWTSFVTALRRAPASAQNQSILWVMLDNADRKFPLDQHGMLETIEITTARYRFGPDEYRRIGAYIHNETDVPNKALPYLELAVGLSPRGDPETEQLLHQLDDLGRSDWAARLRKLPRPDPKP